MIHITYTVFETILIKHENTRRLEDKSRSKRLEGGNKVMGSNNVIYLNFFLYESRIIFNAIQ